MGRAVRDGEKEEDRPPWSKLLDETRELEIEKQRAIYTVALNIALRLKADEHSVDLLNGIFTGVVIGILMTLAVEISVIYMEGKHLLMVIHNIFQ
jgi:hypothetical protein